ncbi:hypothetical protein D0T49_05860, partial [Paludibacter sp. 221]|nr:hypothetical protein [Paludibacter sp. 221]
PCSRRLVACGLLARQSFEIPCSFTEQTTKYNFAAAGGANAKQLFQLTLLPKKAVFSSLIKISIYVQKLLFQMNNL